MCELRTSWCLTQATSCIGIASYIDECGMQINKIHTWSFDDCRYGNCSIDLGFCGWSVSCDNECNTATSVLVIRTRPDDDDLLCQISVYIIFFRNIIWHQVLLTCICMCLGICTTKQPHATSGKIKPPSGANKHCSQGDIWYKRQREISPYVIMNAEW